MATKATTPPKANDQADEKVADVKVVNLTSAAGTKVSVGADLVDALKSLGFK